MSPSTRDSDEVWPHFCLLTFCFLVALSIDDHDFAEVAQRRSATASAVKYDAAHSRSRHTTALGRCVYACPPLLDWNPIRLCVPSQNGLLLEPPQRHKDITTMVVIGSPLSPLSTTDPLTM